METKKSLLKNSLLFLLFIALLHTTSLCQTGDSLYYTNPGYHLAKELFNRRIIMLGDYGHHQPGPFKRVYDVLDNWLSLCEKKSESTRLTYIIECDGTTIDELNKYITSGDIKYLLDKIAPDFYLEDLEYFTFLRNYSTRIDSVNEFRQHKISFTIKGFEEVGYNYEKVAYLTQKEHDLWFVNERDSTTASGIISYMKSNLSQQILIFYGTAHLQNGYVNKNLGFDDLTDKECMGYYLVHYLKKEFGNNQVITFNTHYYYDGLIQNSEFDSIKNKDFITEPINLKNSSSILTTSDYIFICHSVPLMLIDGSFICSKYILEKAIEKIQEAKKWLPGNVARKNYYQNLYRLFHLTGIRFTNDTSLNQWIGQKHFNTTAWLYSTRFDSILSPLNYIQQEIYRFSSIYGVDISNDSNMTYFNIWKGKLFPLLIKKIKFTNSIGIYWFGYPDEKVKAKEYLVNFSGEDYNEPEKYLQWYRKKFYGYEY